jgi:c-di-GMP-binding flagellar brake protein YcgR
MGMTDRSGRRVRTSCRLAYVGVVQDIEGEAQTIDLSFSGCRATCPSPPPVGTKLHVSVYLPGMEHPLSIELAVVRWVRHTMVGIRFSSVSPPHRERLQAWIMKAPYGGSAHVRTKPCLGT